MCSLIEHLSLRLSFFFGGSKGAGQAEAKGDKHTGRLTRGVVKRTVDKN